MENKFEIAELESDFAGLESGFFELDNAEIEEVSGGFVCGGACLGGLAFGAGALFGSGFQLGFRP